MKGHNYGNCRKCGKIHIHPRGTLGKHLDMSNRRNYNGENNPFFGKHLSEGSKYKLYLSHINLVPWNKGIPRTRETKEK